MQIGISTKKKKRKKIIEQVDDCVKSIPSSRCSILGPLLTHKYIFDTAIIYRISLLCVCVYCISAQPVAMRTLYALLYSSMTLAGCFGSAACVFGVWSSAPNTGIDILRTPRKVLDSRVSPLRFFLSLSVCAALLLNIHTRISPSAGRLGKLSKQKRKDAKAIIGSSAALFLQGKNETKTKNKNKKTACDEKDKDQPPEKQTNKEKKEKNKKKKQDRRPNRSDLLVNNIRRASLTKNRYRPQQREREKKKKLLQLYTSPSEKTNKKQTHTDTHNTNKQESSRCIDIEDRVELWHLV